MADQDSYGKRPWWVWLVVYLIIGGLVYYAVYYFASAKKPGGTKSPTYQDQSPY